MIIYDYVGARGSAKVKQGHSPIKGEVRTWRDNQQVPQRIQFDEKLDSLASAGPELLPGLIAGPLRIKGKGKFPHIYKLQMGGKIRLRPLLCRGTKDFNAEVTLLIGATERDGQFEPLNAPEKADSRRQEILDDDTFRQPYIFP